MEPDNLQQADRTSMAHAVLGEAQLHVGRVEQARASLRRSIDIAERLVARDGNVAQWRDQNLALPQVTLARVHARVGDAQAARMLFATVARNLSGSIARDKPDPRTLRLYCAALAGQARLANRADALWLEIASVLTRHQGSQGPDGLVLLAEAHAALGRLDDARAITSGLAANGYRHPDFASVLERHPTLGTLKVGRAMRAIRFAGDGCRSTGCSLCR